MAGQNAAAVGERTNVSPKKVVRRFKAPVEGQWALYTGRLDLAPEGAVELTEAEIARIQGGDPWQFDADGGIAAPVYVPAPDWVRAEARRRIRAIADEDDQRNILARGDRAEIVRVWAQIDAVRAAGKALLAQTPIPEDFADAKHWPQT